MFISMQGNWKVTVKSKEAAFQQRFVVQGATSGNGIHSGTPGTSVNVIGSQWSIAIQHDPGTGWQSSNTKLTFPHQVGGNYVFDILSNDTGGDKDFNDLILTCSTPANINDFIIYGNVMLYSGACTFNPCRRFPYVIDTVAGLEKALRNPFLRKVIEKLYPERIPRIPVDPNPPDPPPPYFKPMVFDLSGEAMQPKTTLKYMRKAIEEKKKDPKAGKEMSSEFAASDFELIRSFQIKPSVQTMALSPDNIELARTIGELFLWCGTDPGSNLTLTFEEYDRTAAELAGGAYTGTGNRRLLGNTITDMYGNYIFRFKFDMTLPDLEDSSDIAPGEDVNTILYPDIIVKIVEYSPFHVRYESAPFYNIPNLKKINLCLPKSSVNVFFGCHDGNLIGSLGNVFIGGTQNTSGSFLPTALRRTYSSSNFLDEDGKITVGNPMALFTAQCAAWRDTIDIRGCMYDATKPPTSGINQTEWYTIKIKRAGTLDWNYASQNYKHPKFQKENNLLYPNYIGDDVGPSLPDFTGITPGSVLDGHTPAYKNIQRLAVIGGVNEDWDYTNRDRYMQLDTTLYDLDGGTRKPGTFFVQVDCYDGNGKHVTTDLIALYIHNLPLNFLLTSPVLNDPAIVNAGCGLYRLTDAQMKTPIVFSFEANDPYGFVDHYALAMGRCPGTPIDLNSNIEGNFTMAGGHTFPGGNNPANVHNACPGYKGTQDDYSNPGLVSVQIQPPAIGDGWIKTGEYFTVYSFDLQAMQRVTNGYNSGRSDLYHKWAQIMMERLNP